MTLVNFFHLIEGFITMFLVIYLFRASVRNFHEIYGSLCGSIVKTALSTRVLTSFLLAFDTPHRYIFELMHVFSIMVVVGWIMWHVMIYLPKKNKYNAKETY